MATSIEFLKGEVNEDLKKINVNVELLLNEFLRALLSEQTQSAEKK